MKLFDNMEKDVDAIKQQAYRIAWFSRGSVQYADVLNMCPNEFKIANELIKSNLTVTQDSKLPFF